MDVNKPARSGLNGDYGLVALLRRRCSCRGWRLGRGTDATSDIALCVAASCEDFSQKIRGKNTTVLRFLIDHETFPWLLVDTAAVLNMRALFADHLADNDAFLALAQLPVVFLLIRVI